MGGISDAHSLHSQVFGALLSSLRVTSRPRAILLQQKRKLTTLFTIRGRFDLNIVCRRNDQLKLFLPDTSQNQLDAYYFQSNTRLALIVEWPAKRATSKYTRLG